MPPIRETLYILIIVGVLSVGTGAWISYRAHLIDQGRQECQAKVQAAILQAQDIADQNAEIYQAQQTKTRIEYRTRVEKIRELVPVNHACDLPPATVDKLNSAIRGTP